MEKYKQTVLPHDGFADIAVNKFAEENPVSPHWRRTLDESARILVEKAGTDRQMRNTREYLSFVIGFHSETAHIQRQSMRRVSRTGK